MGKERFKMFLLIYLMLPNLSCYTISYEKNAELQKLEAHLADIVLYHQNIGIEHYVVRYGSETASKDLANFFLQKMNSVPNVVIEDTENDSNIVSKLPSPEIVIVFVDFIEVLSEGTKVFWNNRKQHRFIVTTEITNYELVQEACEAIWDMKILNFFISFIYNSALEVIQYNPFLNETSTVKGIGAFKKERINMQQTALRVTLFDYPPRMTKVNDTYYGPDFSLLQGIMDYLNASLEVLDTYGGDPFIWLVLNIVYRSADIGFVISFYPPISTSQYTGFFYPWKMDDLVIIVPHSSQIPQYKYIFLIFALSVWIAIFAAWLTVAIVDAFVLDPEVLLKQSLLESYTALLGKSIRRMIKGKASIKTMYIFWFYISMVLTVAFQSTLTGMMVTPKYYKEFETIQDLKDHNVRIMVNFNHALNIPETMYPNKLLMKTYDPTLMSRLVGGITAVYAVQKNVAEELPGEKYYIVKEHMVPGLSSYQVSRFCPYLDAINMYLLYDKEFGLNRFQRDGKNVKENISEVMPLSIIHLQTVFYILIAGEFLSILLFCGEVIFAKVN